MPCQAFDPVMCLQINEAVRALLRSDGMIVNFLRSAGISPDLVMLAMLAIILLQGGNIGRKWKRGARLLLRTSPALIVAIIELLKG